MLGTITGVHRWIFSAGVYRWSQRWRPPSAGASAGSHRWIPSLGTTAGLQRWAIPEKRWGPPSDGKQRWDPSLKTNAGTHRCVPSAGHNPTSAGDLPALELALAVIAGFHH